MPVTKTAKRALRVSKRKYQVNQRIRTDLEASIRIAEKNGKESDIKKAISTADKAAKNNVIHKNKAARIKSRLSKLFKPTNNKSESAPAKGKKKKK